MVRALASRTALPALAVVCWLAGSGLAGNAGPPARPGGRAGGSWTVYHGDAAGTGVAHSVRAVDTAARAWTSPALDGQIYGEPLAWSGRVYVATENDTVYALSARTGAVTWSRHLASPVPAGTLPCGNIAPTVGITGTPVIDAGRDEIFAVADELVRGRPAHLLVGLNASTGQRELATVVDPPGADPAALLQRTGLTLDAGQVVFGFGANFGDCGTYRGRVAAVPETGGPPGFFTVDSGPGQSGGAVWMGGAAPAIDGRGRIWVSTGNGSVISSSGGYDHSDAALELSPSLRLLQFFAPASWTPDNAADLDMSTVPVLLPSGQVLLTGKSGTVYLLDGAHLGGIGGQQAVLDQACSGAIDGGAAVVGTVAYLPCVSGIIAVRVARSPAAVRLLWSSGRGGGPPIVAAGLVWTIGLDGTLYGLDPATGRPRQQAAIGAGASHFPAPGVGGWLLLAPAANRVVAFAALTSGGPSARPSVTPGTRASGPGGGGSGAGRAGTARTALIAAIGLGCLVLIGVAGWLISRRRGGLR